MKPLLHCAIFGHRLMGKIDLPVKLGNFESKQTFVVVDKLVVDCILGADFLLNHGALLDCSNHSLHLCTSLGHFCVPLHKMELSPDARETLTALWCVQHTLCVGVLSTPWCAHHT